MQNLTATFLCHKCTCWWESNGQRLSGEDIAENLLSMSAVHKENYLLTRLNPHLYIFMTAMSHFPSLFMTRAPKSCEILRMSHQPNSLYPSAQFFTKFKSFSSKINLIWVQTECIPTSLVAVWSHQITGTMLYIVQTIHLNCYNIISCGKQNLAKHTNMRSPIQFKKERKTGWFKVQPLL